MHIYQSAQTIEKPYLEKQKNLLSTIKVLKSLWASIETKLSVEIKKELNNLVITSDHGENSFLEYYRDQLRSITF